MAFGKRGAAAVQPRAARKPLRVDEPANASSEDFDEQTLSAVAAGLSDAAGPARPSAKTVNLTAALVVRGFIIFAVFTILVSKALADGGLNQWIALALFAMAADYGRVLRKALRSGAD